MNTRLEIEARLISRLERSNYVAPEDLASHDDELHFAMYVIYDADMCRVTGFGKSLFAPSQKTLDWVLERKANV